MAIRRVTGAVSPSELVFADANALGATYDGSGTTIERGETFTLPAAGTTAVSNGALRLEALKGDCTITNNGNSTLTNASGVDGTILMRSGATEFPAYVKNSSMSSMEVPARESFEGIVTATGGTFSGTINSGTTFPAGNVIQVKRGQLPEIAGTDKELWPSNYNENAFSSSTPYVVNWNGSNLEITGFSASSGNIILVTWTYGLLETASGNVCLSGFKIGSDFYTTNFFQGGDAGGDKGRYTMVSTGTIILDSALSNATISAAVSAPNNTASKLLYYAYESHSSYAHRPSITVMEIQQ